MVKWPIHVNQMGARRVVTRTKWTGFAIAALITIGHVTENIVLLDHSEWPAYLDLHIVQVSRPHKARGCFDKAAVITCVLLNIVEFVCFVVILGELRKHHR